MQKGSQVRDRCRKTRCGRHEWQFFSATSLADWSILMPHLRASEFGFFRHLLISAPSERRDGRVSLTFQNHCPGSISPSSINCREDHSNLTELCHQKVGMSYFEPGLSLSALAVRKEQTAAVRL